MKTINLTQGKVALVDDEDYGYLNKWKWHVHKVGNIYYAVRNVYKPKQRKIHMHRVILNATDGVEVDHINSNGLDNQKLNLRLCTRSENMRNQRLSCRNTIGFKGVFFDKGRISKPCCAQIRLNNKNIHLGRYHTLKEAAQAYDRAALRYHKEFALTNKMLGLL